MNDDLMKMTCDELRTEMQRTQSERIANMVKAMRVPPSKRSRFKELNKQLEQRYNKCLEVIALTEGHETGPEGD